MSQILDNTTVDTRPLMVSIKCLVYNHEPYLRDCLDGIVMQKTNFRFEAVVHDDVSTDGSTAIIREYAEKYSNIIKPIYETENQYSKHDGSLRKIMDDACTGKYVAICEGDDYWIDPMKLQKQFDYMESHPDCMLCASGARILYGQEEKEWNRGESRILSTEEIVSHGGFYLPTPSYFYRKSVKDDYPEVCKKCKVGDHPLQIYCSLKGTVYYCSEKMVAYRYRSPGSWSSRDMKCSFDTDFSIKSSQMEMLAAMDKYSNYKYSDAFNKGILFYVRKLMFRHPSATKFVIDYARNLSPRCFNMLTWKDLIRYYMCKYKLQFVLSIYNKMKKR